MLTKAPLVKLGQRRNPEVATPRIKMSSVITRGLDFQSSRMIKPADRTTTRAIKGELLSIRSRIATVTQAATTSVAQIELAASQNRQEVTKLDEKEADAATEIRPCTASDKIPLKCRLTLIVDLLLEVTLFAPGNLARIVSF